MQTKYERATYQFLAFYRFFSYSLAVVFLQVVPPGGLPVIPDLQEYIVVSVLGVYTLLKVFSPIRWQERGRMTYIMLIGDFVLCILLVIFTNGLNSAFLLYSLTPIITAALLFEEKVTISLAALASLSLSTTHLALSQFSDRFSWIMQGYNLTLLIIYTFFCFVIASLTYRTNINVRRHIEWEAIIEERRRIGREIHDGVAQSLGYLNLKTKMVSGSVSSQNKEQALAGLDEIAQIVKDSYEDVREAIDQLSTEPRSLPLVPALSDYIKEFSGRAGIKVKTSFSRVLPGLSPVAELQLLRIAQEALTNIRRHSLATEVTVELQNDVSAIEMMVSDNGKGFDIAEYEEASAGYHGLRIIKERTEGLGGKLRISTAPGEGTEIKVSLPIEKVRI